MPDNDNPYAAPTSQDASDTDAPLPQIWVDGRFLVVANGGKLPSRCVFTNEPVPEPLLDQTFKWAPSFRPVISERKIRLKFAVNLRRQRKQRLVRFAGSLAQVLAAITFYTCVSENLSFISGILILSAIVAFVEKPTYLAISKCQNDRFWLAGCGSEFLASCIDEFGTRFEPGRSQYQSHS